jgi:hypothetical protein
MPKLVWNPKIKEWEWAYVVEEKEEKSAGVVPYQDQMRIRKLYGGLPIYETSSGLSPIVGEIYLIDSGSKRICVRFDNIVCSTSLT